MLIIGDDPEWNRMVDTMGRVIDIIDPLGMKPVFEAFARQAVADRPMLSPMSACLKFIEDCKPKYVGMCPDPRQQYRDEKSFASLQGVGTNRDAGPIRAIERSGRARRPLGFTRDPAWRRLCAAV